MTLLQFFYFFLLICFTQQGYDTIQSDVLYWLNQVRANPAIIIPHIQDRLSRFTGNMIPIAPYFNYATKEGPSSWLEAIEFLRQQRPMGTLQRHRGLDRAALDHANDLKEHNTIRHEGTDGTKPRQRIERYNVYEFGQISQNIAQQFTHQSRNHGLQTIVSLIIDDGVKDRGHRFSLFTPKYNYAGVSTQQTTDHYVTVIELSSHNLALKGNHLQYAGGIPGYATPNINQNFNNNNNVNNNNIIDINNNNIRKSYSINRNTNFQQTFTFTNPLSIHQNFDEFRKIFLQMYPQGKSVVSKPQEASKQSVAPEKSNQRVNQPSYNFSAKWRYG